MKIIITLFCIISTIKLSTPAPANGFIFPDERRERKLEPIITPPVLPILEHLERDPSTLLPNETPRRSSGPPTARRVNPKFGFGGGYNVAPSGNGGLTASISSSANGGGASQSASQSFSFGFNNGFSASQSASQASSFNGFGGGISGSQASSQAGSFSSQGFSGASSASSAFSGGSASQSASSAFGFNSINNGFSSPDSTYDDVLDVRHRGIQNFPIPNHFGRGNGIGAAAFRSNQASPRRSSSRSDDDFLAILVSS